MTTPTLLTWHCFCDCFLIKRFTSC